MEKKIHSRFRKSIVIFITTAVTLCMIVSFSIIGVSTIKNKNSSNLQAQVYDRLYHIVVTGTYESGAYLQKVYEGAAAVTNKYNAVVELHIPSSEAEDFSLQEAIDYAAFVNADGIITYVNSSDTNLIQLPRTDETSIPLVTTGQYASNLNQISYIGISYWELGKKIAEEIDHYLAETGTAYIINNNPALSISNTNIYPSLTSTLAQKGKKSVDVKTLNSIESGINYNKENTVIICLSEEDTIYAAQYLADLYPHKQYILMGYGNNETCQLYFEKGLIDDLLTLDPVKIGSVALKELFEFRNNGYANSYITADLKETRNTK